MNTCVYCICREHTSVKTINLVKNMRKGRGEVDNLKFNSKSKYKVQMLTPTFIFSGLCNRFALGTSSETYLKNRKCGTLLYKRNKTSGTKKHL